MNSERPPQIRYARTDDGAAIAYFKLGRGPVLMEVPHIQMSHLQREWRIPAVRDFWLRLARRHTLVRFDNRGAGLSHGGPRDYSLAGLARDIEAVARAARLERFALFGRISGALPAVQYAAEHAEQVTHLVLWNGFVRNVDHGQAPRLGSLFAMAAEDWELFTESISQAAMGWADSEAARDFADVLRLATTQQAFLSFLESRQHWDLGPVLERVRTPALVLLDEGNRLASAARCRELAAGLREARFQSVKGACGMPGPDAVAIIERFIGGAEAAQTAARAERAEPLTVRESQVLAMLATGDGNADIARRLGISINTVTRHLTHIYAKIGVENRAQAIRYVLERGMADA